MWFRTIATLLAAMAGMGSLAIAAPSPAVQSIAVDRTAFVITLTDGSVLPQEALSGVVLTFGDGTGAQRRLRIDGMQPDPMDPSNETMLYTFSEQDADGGEWHNACQPDPQGRRMGFPLTGAFTKDMRHIDVPGRILITCTGGAEGKCIRFGYKPWRQGSDGASLAPYYQACVRLVRADYCGDGVGHTRNGTPIDLFDHIGIQRDEPAPGMSFEAAFNPDGAICVAHPRLPDEVSPNRLQEICPRLASHVGPSCDETAPGLIFVRSFGQLSPP